MKRIIGTLVGVIATTSAFANQVVNKSSTTNKPKILVLLSGSDFVTTTEGNRHPTGYFLSELGGPTQALVKSGYELVIATPGGKVPSMDAISDDPKWFKNKEEYQITNQFVRNLAGLRSPVNINRLDTKDLSGFSGILVPGGHAPVEDLSHDRNVARILNYFHNAHKPTGLICHGPAALISTATSQTFIYEGYKMTGFSTAEEQQEENAGHLDGHMPFYVDQELGRLGGEVTVATPWSSNAIRDRELITGQNPMSEEAFTALYLEALVESRFARMLPKTISTTATIMPNQLYQMGSMSFDPHVWKHPYTTLWIGQRSDSSNDFWQHLKRHIELTSATFADKGLDGYIFYGSDDYEIALMHWTSKEAATAAFASKSGQNVVKDAGSFLTPVLFQETAITPRAQ